MQPELKIDLVNDRSPSSLMQLNHLLIMAPRLLALGLFSLIACLVSAQGDYVISNIDIPTADNGTATIEAGKVFLSFVNATIANGFDYSVRILLTFGVRMLPNIIAVPQG